MSGDNSLFSWFSDQAVSSHIKIPTMLINTPKTESYIHKYLSL